MHVRVHKAVRHNLYRLVQDDKNGMKDEEGMVHNKICWSGDYLQKVLWGCCTVVQEKKKGG